MLKSERLGDDPLARKPQGAIATETTSRAEALKRAVREKGILSIKAEVAVGGASQIYRLCLYRMEYVIQCAPVGTRDGDREVWKFTGPLVPTPVLDALEEAVAKEKPREVTL